LIEEPKLSNFKIRGSISQNNENRGPKLQLSIKRKERIEIAKKHQN